VKFWTKSAEIPITRPTKPRRTGGALCRMPINHAARFSAFGTSCSYFLRLCICFQFIFTARCYALARYMPARGVRPSVCLSVRPSVTSVSCAKTNKDIFKNFSPCGSQAILVFPYQTGWRYSNGNPPNGGVECKGI